MPLPRDLILFPIRIKSHQIVTYESPLSIDNHGVLVWSKIPYSLVIAASFVHFLTAQDPDMGDFRVLPTYPCVAYISSYKQYFPHQSGLEDSYYLTQIVDVSLSHLRNILQYLHCGIFTVQEVRIRIKDPGIPLLFRNYLNFSPTPFPGEFGLLGTHILTSGPNGVTAEERLTSFNVFLVWLKNRGHNFASLLDGFSGFRKLSNLMVKARGRRNSPSKKRWYGVGSRLSGQWTGEQTDRERQRDETEVATTPRRRHDRGGTPTALVWIAMAVIREAVTRSTSRQDSHSGNTSSHSSLEDLAQRVELSPLVEESPDVSIEELKVNEHDERFVQSVSIMAEARGPSITPLKFRGSLEENVEDYLQGFERVSRANGWDEPKKLVVIPCYLEGAALKWYENLEEAEGNNLTWDTVKRKMKEAFQWIAWEEQLEFKLRLRMQGEDEQVEAYIQDVLNLGLKPSLLEKVMMMNNDTLEDVLTNVIKVRTVRFVAGQRVNQILAEPILRGAGHVAATSAPHSNSSSLVNKIENLASEFAKFSMHLMEQRKNEENIK
ncbi:aspartic-type endopeptidase activity protein [Homalodisca vitripennis]|nr:aspartic-type endopeptidase activity protein [Homalodisca vitripennis]